MVQHCAFCGKEGVNRLTCPFNPKSKNSQPSRHNKGPLKPIKKQKQKKGGSSSSYSVQLVNSRLDYDDVMSYLRRYYRRVQQKSATKF